MNSKFKIADIRKIEIFAPGTAGERAIRVETNKVVEIFDQNKFPELEFKDLEAFVEDFYKTDTDFPGSLGKIS